MKKLLALSAALVLTACGSATDSAPVESVSADQKTVVAESTVNAVPERVIIRIPLDAAGNPAGEPEFRVLQQASEISSAQAASTAFASGTAPSRLVTTVDELDQDTSTQSWYWNNWGWRHNWGGGWGWNHFNPRFGWGGNHWNYGFVNNWTWNGYGYGCYDRGWW